MNILLLNPYITDFTAYDLWLRPLGLMYVSSVLKKHTDSRVFWIDVLDRFSEGTETKGREDGRGKFLRTVIDKPEALKDIPRTYARYGLPLELFYKKIAELPEIQLIMVTSLMTYWTDGLRFTIDAVKQRFPRAPVILGGMVPSLMPEFSQSSLPADMVIQGYGEKQVLEIVESAGASVNWPAHGFLHPDDLPWPDVEFMGSRHHVPLMTSRGCPMNCSYCASGLLNPRFIERSPESVTAEIRSRVDLYSTKHFIIFDDAFLINKTQRFFKIADACINMNIRFHTPNGLHVREIDFTTAEYLFAAGFSTLRLSFESTSEDIIHRSTDKTSVSMMIQAVENLINAGFSRKDIEVYLLFGLPGQSLPAVYEAIDFAASLGVRPRLSFYSPVPGTRDCISLQKTKKISCPVHPYETNKIVHLYRNSGYSSAEIKEVKDYCSAILDHK